MELSSILSWKHYAIGAGNLRFGKVTVALLTQWKQSWIQSWKRKRHPCFFLGRSHAASSVFFPLYTAKKVQKIGTAQAYLMKDDKSTLLLRCSFSACSSAYKDQGFSIWNTAQTAGNSARCNEPRNTKDSCISYMSFINFN